MPDFGVQVRGGIVPQSPLFPRPMRYAKFMACLRGIFTRPPLSLRPEDAMRVSTYSLRRFLPTVADRLRVPVDRRHDLGDWCDTPLDGAAPVRHAPMAVRYSDARLETSADTRRVCHLALHVARRAKYEEDEDIRALSPQVLALYEQVLSRAWVFAARAVDVRSLPRLPPPPAQPANETDDSSDSSSYSSSSSRSSSPSASPPRPSSSTTEARSQRDPLEWIMPTRTAAKLHLKLGVVDDRGRVIPPCRSRPYVFGYREGVGITASRATGAKWCTECARLARERGYDLEEGP